MSTLETILQIEARAKQTAPRKVLTEADKANIAVCRREMAVALKSGDSEMAMLSARVIKKIEGPLF